MPTVGRKTFVSVSHPQLGRTSGRIPSEAAKSMFRKLCKREDFPVKRPIVFTFRELYSNRLHHYWGMLVPKPCAYMNTSVTDGTNPSPLQQVVRKLKQDKPHPKQLAQMRNRKFVCVYPNTKSIYRSSKPNRAAKKALTKLRRTHNIVPGQSITIVLRELRTRTFYHYECKLEKLAVPKTFTCNGTTVTSNYTSRVCLVTRTEFNHLSQKQYSNVIHAYLSKCLLLGKDVHNSGKERTLQSKTNNDRVSTKPYVNSLPTFTSVLTSSMDVCSRHLSQLRAYIIDKH